VSFINPFFLFALGGALLPVIIHLIRKMRAKKVKFSSLLFLKATPKELIKRRRLRDLILLIARSAILALLAFAFARPFIPRERIPFAAPDERKSTVILIDNSYSMQYGGIFDRVREAAAGVLDDAGDGDEFSVVVFNEEARQITALGPDIAVHRNAVDNLITPGFRTTDFYNPVKLAEGILQEAGNPERRIILISDFQNLGWTGRFENWKIDPQITVIPEKIAVENIENAYVYNFDFRSSRAGSENVVEYNMEMGKSGTAKRDETAALWIDGRLVEQQRVNDDVMNRITFQQREVREGLHQGYVTTGGDNLDADNARYFTYAVEPLPKILCVDEGENRTQRDAFYLESAFGLGEESLYSFAGAGSNRIARGYMRDKQLVFLANVRTLSDSRIEMLRQYVSEGGGLVISFGDRSNPDIWSAVMDAFGVGSIEDRVVVREVQDQDAIIGEVNMKHPVFSVFAQAGGGDIFRPKFRQYVRITPGEDTDVIARYDTGDPMIIERKTGRGTILVYTSTFNTDWSDFPVHEIYLPFLYQLAGYTIMREKQRAHYTVGESVPLEGEQGDEWVVSAPGDRMFKVEIDESGNGLFRLTDMPGNYTAVMGPGRVAFSVNVDVRESELETRDIEEAVALIVRPSDREEFGHFAGAAIDVDEQEKEQKLWRYIVIALIVLFAFETWYANRRVPVKSG